MSTFMDCEHARRCDKCHLYHCANDDIIACRGCNEPALCSKCFFVKKQDPCSWEWYCDRRYCREAAKRHAEKCSQCGNNCIKHKKRVDDGYLCRRCVWWSTRRKGRKHS